MIMMHHFLTGCFIVVDIDSLKLQVRVALVLPIWLDTMLVADYFPELKKHYNHHHQHVRINVHFIINYKDY